MVEFHFTLWFHGLNKRIIALLSEYVDPDKVEIQVQPAFYMNLSYNAKVGSGLSVNPDGKMALHGCRINPCLQSTDAYYKIVVDGVIFYKRLEL